MKYAALLCFLFLTISSCQKDPPVAIPNTSFPAIVGDWKLMQVSGGFGGGQLPVDTGNEKITFLLSGIYTSESRYFLSEGVYAITNDTTIDSGYRKYLIQLKDNKDNPSTTSPH